MDASSGGEDRSTPIKPLAWEWLWWKLREDARVFGVFDAPPHLHEASRLTAPRPSRPEQEVDR